MPLEARLLTGLALSVAAAYLVTPLAIRLAHQFAFFDRPVLFTLGGHSNAFWDRMAVRLADLFPSFSVRRWPTASHLATSHQIDRAGVADALRELWSDRSA